MMRSVKGEVVSFTFVELAYRHVQLAEIGANSTDIAENLNELHYTNICCPDRVPLKIRINLEAIVKGANSTDIAENLNDVRASNIYLLVHKYETPLNVITHGMYSIPSRHDSKARHAHPTKLIEAHPSKIWYAEEEDLGIVFFFVFLQEIAPLLARVEWSRLM
ncbi:hypothetical protein DINM_000345 [Dirofilaria immitis]|nr:hypothetical protein [Dirofilaria immitis]